jgi:hypothetical protein
MTDQNRKTLRSFYCRDYLWDLFEQMTQELGCSMDYLINESMRLYARSRDFAPGEGDGGGGDAYQRRPTSSNQPSLNRGAPQNADVDRMNVGGRGSDSGMDHRTFERMPAVRNQRGGQQGQKGQQGQQRGPGGPPPPPPRPGQGGGGGFQQQQQQQQRSRPQNQGRSQQQQQPLYMIFNNNRYVVDNDKFVIGRGSQQTDLTIRDGNISRKHCAILRRNGNFYIKDLDSTNGVEYRGNRIESKRIEEGDVFYLCDYELRFTYRG